MDLIDRQAAIDAARDWYEGLICGSFRGLEKRLQAVPSAQPEIIHCKDCKWCEDANGLMCKNPASWVVATDYDFGCVLAERKTDGSD